MTWFGVVLQLHYSACEKAKRIKTCSHAFSRAWRRLHVFTSSSDWLIALFSSVVIMAKVINELESESVERGDTEGVRVLHQMSSIRGYKMGRE